MKSHASFKAHPLHPALIPFPFAFLTGAAIFDVAGRILDKPALWTTGSHLTLAGIVAGILAAIPGVIDYLYTVPPRSSGKKRATRHAVGNLAALILFAAAWTLRGDALEPGVVTLGLEVAGAMLLAYSGWLGGTLVTRNLISVDHRYAHAGKWQEANLAATDSGPVLVGHADDLEDGQMKLLRVNGRRIVLARTPNGYTAFDDRCSHRGGSLAGGVLIGETVHCLWHGSQFDVEHGDATCGPATESIRVYPLQQTKDGKVLLVSPPE